MADTTKTQPTILVKKADGTSERITLAEFRLRKQGKSEVRIEKKIEDQRLKIEDSNAKEISHTQPTPRRAIPLVEEQRTVRRAIPLVEEVENTPVKPQMRRVIPFIEETQIVKSTVPVVRTENRVATTTPVSRVFEQPVTPKQKVEDHRSLLDDDGDEIAVLTEKNNTPHASTTSVSFSSSVTIPKDLEARTTSLILSWKKGIRDKHQFLDYAAKPTSEGGLGLARGNAEKLFSEISENATLTAPVIPVTPPGLRPPSPTRGGNATISQKKLQMQQIPTPPSLIREVASATSTSRVMGPTEEAAAFTLEDFRRLSRNPKTAGEMLLAKFSGWKDESYLLYLQVRDSWRNSPLFRLYIDTTVTAIQKNVALVSILEGSTIGYDEYLAITEVNRKMGMMD